MNAGLARGVENVVAYDATASVLLEVNVLGSYVWTQVVVDNRVSIRKIK
jgi:hypothetical protein